MFSLVLLVASGLTHQPHGYHHGPWPHSSSHQFHGYDARPVAFLQQSSTPNVAAEEGVGPNLHFPPLSTTMKCTINLTIQYMVIFTALGLCRTYLDFQGEAYSTSTVQKALKHASETVFYAPMACLLFVGFRMRVLQLTKGTGSPPEYVQLAMQCVAYSILANTLMVLVIPVFVKNEVQLDEKTHEMKLDGANPFENTALAAVFTAVRYGCFLALYVGFGIVVYGLATFEPEAGVWDGPTPPLSPAVFCTCMLSCAFFFCYCMLAISRTYSQFTVGNTKETMFETTMLQGANTLAMAPMFCVLFLAARMRALQMDPVNGNPQKWAQNCFYTCTWALCVQCLLAIAIPLAGVGSVEKGMVEGDLELKVGESGSMLAKVLTGCRWFIMVCIYAAAIAVVCSVFTITNQIEGEVTPPISPTMHCVINLSWQYFTIYIVVWAFVTFEHFTTWRSAWLTTIKDAVASAKTTVEYAPMLCVLFIATRMRALQITENKGAPQGYVQDGMYLASWAVLIQFMMCLVMPFMTGEKFEVRSLAGDGPQHDKPVHKDGISNYWGGIAVQSVRYLAVVALFGGTAAVITGVCLMTPENANGRGSMPLVGDHIQPAPMVTDVPYMKDTMKTTGETIGQGADVVQGAGAGVEGVATGAADAAKGIAK